MSKLSKLLISLIFIAILATNVAADQAPSAIANTDNIEAVDQTASDTANNDGTLAASQNTVYGVSETGLYIVVLADPAIPSYTGGIDGLAATNPETLGQNRLDTNSDAVQAYANYLYEKQEAFLASANDTLGRTLDVQYRYDAALNGVAVAASHEEALALAALPGVTAVYGDTIRHIETDIGPDHIGAPSIWTGNTGSGIGTYGEGVIVGIIDSGINFSHPSFAATDGNGYTHTNPYGTGVYHGWCATNPGFCNDKLIGAYALSGTTPEDNDGHGSHTGSTTAGNAHDATFNVGAESYTLPISGVAPQANIVAYKVCNPGCPGSASIQAVNHAINDDDVDVLNYSISGSDNPWVDTVDQAFLNGFNAGIYINASAGNDGPGPSTAAKSGPWNASTAAGTINRIIAHTVDIIAPTAPAELQGLAATAGENVVLSTDVDAPIIYDSSNLRGCTAFTAGFFTGSIALIERGDCNFSLKQANAAAAGAVGVIIYNNVGGPPAVMGETTATPPALMIDNASGLAVRAYIDANPGAEASINAPTSLIVNDDWENIVGGFSSRGPSQFELLIPTFIAPGVNTLAAGSNPGEYFFSQGTSMSSPHAAGAGALLKALNPTWSPAEIRSALALTANPDGYLKEDALTPADPFDIGSGLVNLEGAGNIGLVLDETHQNFVDANPAIGGDPTTLNVPSLVDYECDGTCSWVRTFTSVASDTITYTVDSTSPDGIVVTADPASFAVAPGATQVITFTADVTGLALGDYLFADVQLVPELDTSAALLLEDFSGETFPPAGWTHVLEAGSAAAQWSRTTSQYNSAPAAAWRNWASGQQTDWLITPPLAITSANASLSFLDAGQWMDDYIYQGVWVSTASCNPVDGDFVELIEVDDTPGAAGTFTWRTAPLEVDLSAYVGQTICLAFFYDGNFANAWVIDDVIVADGELTTPASPIHLPVVAVAIENVPEIDVDPTSLEAIQTADTITTQALTISNVGEVDLDWEFVANTGAGTLWEQLSNGTSGIVSDYSATSAAGAYTANDFTLNAGATIEVIFADGFDNTNTLAAQPAITWAIYADDGGSPLGYPEDGLNQELWSFTTTPTGTGVDITGNDILLDLTAAGESLHLPAGTYWLTVYPTYNGPITGAGDARWNWGQGTPMGAETQLVSPVLFGVPDWTPLTGLGLAWSDTAFRIEGIGDACGDTWVSVAPTSGSTTPGDNAEVTVTFDSTGLADGTYTATLCIESNDPTTPYTIVPVTLEVGDFADPEIVVDPIELESTQLPNEITTQELNIENVGGLDLNWAISEFPANNVTLDLNNQVDANVEGGISLVIDDGVAENGLGLTSGAQFVWFNRFTPNAADFPFTLNEVEVLFRSQDGVNIGEAIDIYIYQDADGNPANGATHVASLTGQTIQALDTFSVYPINAALTGPGDVLIALVNRGSTTPSTYPASVDQSTAQGRSWVAFNAVPADPPVFPMPSMGTIDSLGFPGNFIVRGYGSTGVSACAGGANQPWLSVAPASGTTAPGANTDVTVTFDSTGLATGTYEAELCIDSNDPANPVVTVPVTLEVGGDFPVIDVDATSVDSTQPADTSYTESFGIGNTGTADLTWNIDEDAGEAIAGGWSDNFDSYTTGSGINGQGGWEAWEGDVTWDATVSDAQALSAPNSIDIVGDADIVHPFSGYTSGQWVITAQQYIPTGFTGQSYFIFLNTYGGTHNWSTQVMLDATTGMVINEGVSSGTLPFVTDEWVEIRMEIDLDNNTQAFYYGGDLLYTGTWTEEQSGGGALNLGALDLFANGASSVYYDDISLTPATVTPVTCSAVNDIPWASVSPTSGTTAAGASSSVDVTFDSTGLAEGSYAGTLCIHSNDTANPLVELPVTLTVDNTAVVYAVDVTASPDALSGTVGSSVMYHVEVTNNGSDVDTFDISVAGNAWTSTPDVATVTLNPGETAMVMVTVDIPVTAVDGETDTVTVTATSQGDNTVSDSVDLTTTAEDDGVTPPTGYTIYLPVVIKP